MSLFTLCILWVIVECWLWYKKAFLAPIENLYAAHGINNLILRGHATRPFVNIPMPHSYVLLGSLILFPKVLLHSYWITVCFNNWIVENKKLQRYVLKCRLNYTFVERFFTGLSSDMDLFQNSRQFFRNLWQQYI